MLDFCADGMVLIYVLVSFFVDQNVQLKLVGEYYVKSFMKNYLLLLCVCVIIKVFSLYVLWFVFSQEEEEGKWWWQQRW